MQANLEKIMKAMQEFNDDAAKRVGGNKTAGQRSRVKSLELAALLKEWRKVSNAE